MSTGPRGGKLAAYRGVDGRTYTAMHEPVHCQPPPRFISKFPPNTR